MRTLRHDAPAHDDLDGRVAAGRDVTQFKVFGHGIISWLTRGVSTGLYRNWSSIHTDDLFLPDGRWRIEGHCTRGAD